MKKIFGEKTFKGTFFKYKKFDLNSKIKKSIESVSHLKIFIDRNKTKTDVEQITQTEYFKDLNEIVVKIKRPFHNYNFGKHKQKNYYVC